MVISFLTVNEILSLKKFIISFVSVSDFGMMGSLTQSTLARSSGWVWAPPSTPQSKTPNSESLECNRRMNISSFESRMESTNESFILWMLSSKEHFCLDFNRQNVYNVSSKTFHLYEEIFKTFWMFNVSSKHLQLSFIVKYRKSLNVLKMLCNNQVECIWI